VTVAQRLSLWPAWLPRMQAWQSGLLAGVDGAEEIAEACRAARIRVLGASLEEGRCQQQAESRQRAGRAQHRRVPSLSCLFGRSKGTTIAMD
jgi:hypothetical protein